jgi:hypothetical protein
MNKSKEEIIKILKKRKDSSGSGIFITSTPIIAVRKNAK